LVLSIARQFGSAATAAVVDVPTTAASKSALVHVLVRAGVMLNTPYYLVVLAQMGRSPVQAGRASHSDQRILRSSFPTLTNTKGASSRPVFEPVKTAGTP
jgi:hypothetical protein